MTTTYRQGQPQRWGVDAMPLDPRNVVVGGVSIPRRFAGYFTVPEVDVAAEVTVRMNSTGEPLVEDLRIVGMKWRGVNYFTGTDSDMRSAWRRDRAYGPTVPVSAGAVRAVAKALPDGIRRLVALWAEEDGGRRAVSRRLEDARARRRMTHAELANVAAVYREHERFDPRQRVAEYLGRSPETASKWIRAARDAGLLGEPPGPGLAGETTKGKGKRR